MKKLFILFFVLSSFFIHNCYSSGINAYSNRTAIKGLKKKLNELENQNKKLIEEHKKLKKSFMGVISIWSGQEDKIPEGWVLCDGKNGSPDLRDKFVIGAGKRYRAGDTGGKSFVKLNVNQIEEYAYDVNERENSHINNDINRDHSGAVYATQINSAERNKHGKNHLPYYALCFIMNKYH